MTAPASSLVAFRLRDEYAETVEVEGEQVLTFQGGQVALPDTTTLDIGRALDEEPHPGLIIFEASDLAAVDQLRAYPALEETEVPKGAEPSGGYGGRTVPALRSALADRGLPQKGKKDELVDRLEQHDRATAAGDTEAIAALQAGDGDQAGNGEEG